MRRQNSKRILLATFVFAFLTVFSANQLSNTNVEAKTDLTNFNPGFIISDYMMTKADAMTEEEIQAFLTGKNSCSNTDEAYYNALSQNTSYKWHFKDGHFVCLSEELFGDGEIIGEGETAAHIIWQAAQDYQINPQVLLVLLQKETGLITDPIPNDKDYRKATGYGCPDTAACSEKYYGFKNQIRNAASLFHTVVTGGWTNFILGENYIQYNPNAGCGGSMVNIQSLATAALYRYTPYQPNAGALAAGYGTAECGAYGNRNFYLYFNDWFSDPTFDGWQAMETPRYLVNEATAEVTYFTIKRVKNGRLCLGTDANSEACVYFDELKEAEWPKTEMLYKRYLVANKDTGFINPITNQVVKEIKQGERYYFEDKYLVADNKQCLAIRSAEGCVREEDLSEDWQAMEIVREMAATKETYKVQPITNEKNYDIKINPGLVRKFVSKIMKGNEWCLRTEYDEERGINTCLLLSELQETWNYFENNQNLTVTEGTKKINVKNLAEDIFVEEGTNRNFTSKQYAFGKNEWCYRTEYDTNLGTDNCILESKLNINTPETQPEADLNTTEQLPGEGA